MEFSHSSASQTKSNQISKDRDEQDQRNNSQRRRAYKNWVESHEKSNRRTKNLSGPGIQISYVKEDRVLLNDGMHLIPDSFHPKTEVNHAIKDVFLEIVLLEQKTSIQQKSFGSEDAQCIVKTKKSALQESEGSIRIRDGK